MGQPLLGAAGGHLHVIDGSTFQRFPTLRVGVFEGDVGWLPHWLGRMEEDRSEKFALLSQYRNGGRSGNTAIRCSISGGEPDDLGLAHAAELVGADRILFASDWPHMDGAWPDPLAIVRDRVDLTDDQKRAILVDGPAK